MYIKRGVVQFLDTQKTKMAYGEKSGWWLSDAVCIIWTIASVIAVVAIIVLSIIVGSPQDCVTTSDDNFFTRTDLYGNELQCPASSGRRLQSNERSPYEKHVSKHYLSIALGSAILGSSKITGQTLDPGYLTDFVYYACPATTTSESDYVTQSTNDYATFKLVSQKYTTTGKQIDHPTTLKASGNYKLPVVPSMDVHVCIQMPHSLYLTVGVGGGYTISLNLDNTQKAATDAGIPPQTQISTAGTTIRHSHPNYVTLKYFGLFMGMFSNLTWEGDVSYQPSFKYGHGFVDSEVKRQIRKHHVNEMTTTPFYRISGKDVSKDSMLRFNDIPPLIPTSGIQWESSDSLCDESGARRRLQDAGDGDGRRLQVGGKYAFIIEGGGDCSENGADEIESLDDCIDFITGINHGVPTMFFDTARGGYGDVTSVPTGCNLHLQTKKIAYASYVPTSGALVKSGVASLRVCSSSTVRLRSTRVVSTSASLAIIEDSNCPSTQTLCNRIYGGYWLDGACYSYSTLTSASRSYNCPHVDEYMDREECVKEDIIEELASMTVNKILKSGRQ